MEDGLIEPWRMEEYEAYLKLEKELEVDFSDENLKKHDKVMEFFKLPKEK